MSWFGAFRSHYGFTWYGDNRTAVTFDFPLVTVTYFCVLVSVATLISTLGIRGRERWATSLRAGYAVGIGSIILVCLVGHDWMAGSTEVDTQYLYRSNNHFRGTVGVRMALHSCNVTLQGFYRGVKGTGYVSYAESMKWTDYGKEQETISYYLQRGLPHPVLTVMDFLSVDGGGLRFGRNFHSAGYFACALLWTAFVFWIISNVLLLSVVCYGAFMFSLSGVAMVLSCVVYHVCQPPHDLVIHFGQHVLTAKYGWCFWLTLIAGVVTVVLGALLLMCDHLFHEKVSEFFNLENLDEDDLPDLPHNDSNAKMFNKMDTLPLPLAGGRYGGAQKPGVRRNSLQQPQGQRRGSIFLEPERRPSDYTNGLWRGSLLSCNSSSSLGLTNKGFEQERSRSNPLFNNSSSDIKEENEDGETGDVTREKDVTVVTDVKVELGGEEVNNAGRYDNHKPSLASMREQRDNRLNERHQQARCAANNNSPSLSQHHHHLHHPIPTTIIINASDDEAENGEGIKTRQSDDVVVVDMTGQTDNGGDRCNSCSDSAFTSGEPSPAHSEENSTCGDMEENRL